MSRWVFCASKFFFCLSTGRVLRACLPALYFVSLRHLLPTCICALTRRGAQYKWLILSYYYHKGAGVEELQLARKQHKIWDAGILRQLPVLRFNQRCEISLPSLFFAPFPYDARIMLNQCRSKAAALLPLEPDSFPAIRPYMHIPNRPISGRRCLPISSHSITISQSLIREWN